MSVAKASKADIIKGFRLIRDPVKLGFTVKIFLGVKLLGKMGVRLVDFERAVSCLNSYAEAKPHKTFAYCL